MNNWLESFQPDQVLLETPELTLARRDDSVLLWFQQTKAAGAIGEDASHALDEASTRFDQLQAGHLIIIINSAGAHQKEPLPALSGLNRWLESVWSLKRRGWRITGIIPRYAFGGTALVLATVCDELRLGTDAQLGIVGAGLLKLQHPYPAGLARYPEEKLLQV